jgi:predicted nucleotidyltransferase
MKMLESLFTSKTRVKVLGYVLFRAGGSGLREIAREIGSPVSAVKREVDNLASIGIVSVSRSGVYLNEACPIIDDLRRLFVRTDYFAVPLMKALEGLDVVFAFVFGSFSRGGVREKSDVDLFVVGNASQKEVFAAIKPVEESIGREVNAVVWKKEDIIRKKGSSFIRDMASGDIIMVKGREDELRAIIG